GYPTVSLLYFSEKIDLPYGAKRLFTTNGKLIRHLNDIEDKQDYVASSNHFIPLKYGNTTTSIFHPFRSTSPIKSDINNDLQYEYTSITTVTKSNPQRSQDDQKTLSKWIDECVDHFREEFEDSDKATKWHTSD
ncbi:hypothetical protein GCK32_017988, partial [Trichostrongylus colubriformis]